MKQLGQLHDLYKEFERRDIVVIAVAQEEKDLKKHASILRELPKEPRFPIAADIGCEQTAKYHRTNAYFIDKKRIVRQVFPMLIHHRAVWPPILGEIDAILNRD